MAANTNPIFKLTPYAVFVNLSAQTACASRAPVPTAGLAAANIIAFVPADSVNGRKIDTIRIKASSSSMTSPTAANLVQIWQHDGTTAFLKYELPVTAVTPSTTSPALELEFNFPNIDLPPTHALYVSLSVTTTAAATALTVSASGGDF